jgi:hypothetical protein
VLLMGPSVRSFALNRAVFWFRPKLWLRRMASELEYVIIFVFILVFVVRNRGYFVPGYGEMYKVLLLYANNDFIRSGEAFYLNWHVSSLSIFLFSRRRAILHCVLAD